LIALVGPLTGERHVTQTANFPMRPDAMLPVPDVVLLVSDETDGAMVFRYTAYGELAGDTLHASVAQAKHDVEAEYEDALLSWEDVPDEIVDAHAFAIGYARDRLNERDGS
jgi:hypothetical protein